MFMCIFCAQIFFLVPLNLLNFASRATENRIKEAELTHSKAWGESLERTFLSAAKFLCVEWAKSFSSNFLPSLYLEDTFYYRNNVEEYLRSRLLYSFVLRCLILCLFYNFFPDH